MLILRIAATCFIFTCFLNAQNNLVKYQKYNHDEIDSLMRLSYAKGDYAGAIEYMQAGLLKTENEAGAHDTLRSDYSAYLGLSYKNIGQYEMAEQYYIKAREIRLRLFGEKHYKIASLYNNMAVLYKTMDNFEKAEQVLKKALEIFDATLGRENENYAAGLNNLASLYKQMGYYEKAEILYLNAKEIIKKNFGDEHPDFALYINNLADLYGMMLRYDTAEQLLLQAKSSWAKTLGEDHPDNAIVLNNLGNLYENMKLYDKAEVYFLRAAELWKKTIGPNHPDYAIALYNLAHTYQDMEKFDKAETLFLQALEIIRSAFGSKHSNYSYRLFSLGSLYKVRGEFGKSEKYYAEAIKLYTEIYGKKHPETALSLHNIGTLYMEMLDLEKAFKYLVSSFNANSPDDFVGDFSPESLKNKRFFSDELLYQSLGSLMAYYQKSYNLSKEKIFLVNYHATALIANNYKWGNNLNLYSESDKLLSLSRKNVYTLNAISSAYKLGYKADYIFQLAESSKAILLKEEIKSSYAYIFGEIPDSLKVKENDLIKKQAKLQAKYFEAKDLSIKDSLRIHLNRINSEIEKFNGNINKNFPKYCKLKTDNKNIDIASIQKNIDHKTALLEFAISDSSVFVFYLDKKEILISELAISKGEIEKRVSSFRESLSDFKKVKEGNKESFVQYTNNAYWLYQQLLEPILKRRKELGHLIIVADGDLTHIPFEALLTELPSEVKSLANMSYLLNKFSISYDYSASLWLENNTKQPKNNRKILAMAGNYSAKVDASLTTRHGSVVLLRDKLSELQAAKKEVTFLNNFFEGRFVINKEASEKLFKSESKYYSVLHIATHGLLNKEHPILSSLVFTENNDSFENNFLQAYEISKLELNADLVVLSACETGFGRFETGNGTASLARAFMYAGVPSLVVSLWQVNDASTAEIMQLFYTNLAKGMNKAEALRQAKLKYIVECKNPMMAHPAFWAAFVLIGDSKPVKIMQPGNDYMFVLYALGLISVMLMAIYLLYFRSKKLKRVH